jgi:hypothetical protein
VSGFGEDPREATSPDDPDPALALQILERLIGMVIAHVNPDDINYRGSEANYRRADGQLGAQLRRLGLRSPFPWSTLAEAKGTLKAHASGVGSHAARRERVEELASPLRTQLQHRLNDNAAGDVRSALTEMTSSAAGALRDPSAIRLELTRLERSIDVDPSQSIGRAKNLVESTAKAVLNSLGIEYKASADAPALAMQAMEALGVGPRQESASEIEVTRRLAGKLATIPQDLAQLRNRIGDGHGGLTAPQNVELRHGRLAVRAAIAWCAFMIETLADSLASATDP